MLVVDWFKKQDNKTEQQANLILEADDKKEILSILATPNLA